MCYHLQAINLVRSSSRIAVDMRILVSLLIAVFVFVGAFAQDEGETIDNCAENFYCTEDFCTSTCAPICPLPENDECEGLVMQLYETE